MTWESEWITLLLAVYRQSVLAPSSLRLTTSYCFLQLNPSTYSPYVTSSLPRRPVCRLQFLLALASAVILGSESSGTHDHILLPQIRGSGCESESYVSTDSQSASLSWNKAPIWGLRPDLYYCQTFACLFMWGVLSDERTGLSCAIATGPRQRSNSRVRVPCNSRPYFTVSDLRLPFSSPPTTRRVTVEVFDPASTRVWFWEDFGSPYIVLALSSPTKVKRWLDEQRSGKLANRERPCV
jgi:hypothetical protein